MDKINHEHAEWLHNQCGPMMLFFAELKRRLQKRGYLPTDPIYREVSRCYDALHSLSVIAHYASCKSGVGRDSSDSPPPSDIPPFPPPQPS